MITEIDIKRANELMLVVRSHTAQEGDEVLLNKLAAKLSDYRQTDKDKFSHVKPLQIGLVTNPEQKEG